MTKVKQNKKLDAFIANGVATLDARIASASATHNLIDARKNFIERAALLLACNYDLNALKQNVHQINRKDMNIVDAINGKSRLNHYTTAILKTAINLHNASKKLTMLDVNKCADGEFKSKSEDDKLIVRNVKNNKSSTDATQMSSSVNSLCAFGILKRETKSTFTLDTENANFKALLERI